MSYRPSSLVPSPSPLIPSPSSLAPGDVPFGSNEVRLTPCQWLVTLAIVSAVLYLLPIEYERVEPLESGADYRIPYSLGNDYWMYGRYCRAVCSGVGARGQGRGVREEKSISLAPSPESLAPTLVRFVNMGVDGIHPAAMAGLIEYYGRNISDKNVLLHCNLLWMSSKRRDLQDTKEFAFNHPGLVPQFFPRIPCYREPLSGRLAIGIERHLPFCNWANHLQIAYFSEHDLPTWTIEHPYASPAAALTVELPSPDEPPSPRPVAEPWTSQGVGRMNAPWVELGTSFQWRCFRRAVEILRSRRNRVFVLVGPLNEHMLSDKSRQTYRQRKLEAEAWFRQQKIAYYAAPVLPSDCYADASHPLSEGYAILARQLLENESFRRLQ